jgi:ribosome biogenesis protein ERB1
VAPHPSGQWLATGGGDGCVKLWEVATGRCARTWHLGRSATSSSSGKDTGGAAADDTGPSTSGRGDTAAAVYSVAWCPNPALQLLAVAVGKEVVLLPAGLGGPEAEAAVSQALQAALSSSSSSGGNSSSSCGLATWSVREGDGGGVAIVTQHPVRYVTWHGRGDYFASVAPTGATQVRGGRGGWVLPGGQVKGL